VNSGDVLARLAPAGWIHADLAEPRWMSGFLHPIEVSAAEVAALHRDRLLEAVDVHTDGRVALKIDPEAAQQAVRGLSRPPASHQCDWHLDLGATPVDATHGWGVGEQEPFKVVIGWKKSTFDTMLSRLIAIKNAVVRSDANLVGGTFVGRANLVARHALPSMRPGWLPLHRFEEEDAARFRYLPRRGLLQVRLGRLPGPSVQCEPLRLRSVEDLFPVAAQHEIRTSQQKRMRSSIQELLDAIDQGESAG
jgi:hypothetical protein